MKILTEVQCVDASDFPDEVLGYCTDNDIATHYTNDIVYVKDDGNVLSEWIKGQGFKFGPGKHSIVGIFGR